MLTQVTPKLLDMAKEGLIEVVDMDTETSILDVSDTPVEAPQREAPVTEVIESPEVKEDAVIGEKNDGSETEDQEESESSDSFECDVCHQKFTSARGLTIHKRSHTQD
jgi:hypothetical protein